MNTMHNWGYLKGISIWCTKTGVGVLRMVVGKSFRFVLGRDKGTSKHGLIIASPQPPGQLLAVDDENPLNAVRHARAYAPLLITRMNACDDSSHDVSRCQLPGFFLILSRASLSRPVSFTFASRSRASTTHVIMEEIAIQVLCLPGAVLSMATAAIPAAV